MSDDARRPRLLSIVLLIVIGVVVIAAVIVALVRPGATTFDADTPEGVVQRYAQAMSEGDVETALSHLRPALAEDCDRAPLETGDVRMTLVKTNEHDDTATVRVVVTTIYGSGPFGPSEFQSEDTFSLVREGGQWFIDTTPWQFTVCYDQGIR